MKNFLIFTINYFFICCITYYFACKQSNKLTRGNDFKKVTKYTNLQIFIVSSMFALLNLFITNLSSSYGSDRQNYMIDFYTGREASLGLDFVIYIIHLFSNDIRTLYFFTTFIVVYSTLYSYRIIENSNPKALIYLLSTQFIFLSFTGLKQAYAIALIQLSLSYYLRDNKYDKIKSVILFILSFTFHPTTFIFLPIFIILKNINNRNDIIKYLCMLIIIIIFLKPIILFSAKILLPIVPSVSEKILSYFNNENNIEIEMNSIGIVIKGIPFYLISLWGLINRKYYINKINNFDKYLILSCILSTIYLVSIYEGWIYRLAYYFYLFIAIFFSDVLQESKNIFNRNLLKILYIFPTVFFTIRYLYLVFMQGGF